jgi:AcrR family transcriptional regulator
MDNRLQKPEPRPDRRIERTRRWLHTAILELVAERPYEDIRIQDITDRADTTKVTFYRYFRDKDELFIDALNTMFAEMRAATQSPPVPTTLVDFEHPTMLGLYLHVEERQALYTRIFAGPFGMTVYQKMVDGINEIVQRNLTLSGRLTNSPIPLELLARHIANALLAPLVWWLNNDMPYSPLYMAQLSQWLLAAGMATVLSGQPDLILPSLRTPPEPYQPKETPKAPPP